MAVITGTPGSDTLIGTDADDILQARGRTDWLSGLAGSDEYQIYHSGGAHHLTITDLGGDAGVDLISGGRGLYASASLGYSRWATAERIGDDLMIVLPGKPHRFRDPAHGEVALEIVDHYAGDAIETMDLRGTSYQLATTGPLIIADRDRRGRYL